MTTSRLLRLFFSLTLLIILVSLLSVEASASSNVPSDDEEAVDAFDVQTLIGAQQDPQQVEIIEGIVEQQAQGDEHLGNAAINESDDSDSDNDGIVLEQHLSPQERSESISAQIIAGSVTSLPPDTLSSMDPFHILDILINPLGSRLAAIRFTELFSHLEITSFLTVASFHENFFLELDLFSENRSTFDYESISTDIVAHTMQVQSNAKKLNLRGFIKRLNQFNPEICFNIKQIFLLPHLFDAPRFHGLDFYIGHGLAFNPRGDSSKEDINAWNIAIQLYMYKFSNYPAYGTCTGKEMINEIAEAMAMYFSVDLDPIYNYFGIAVDNECFPLFYNSKTLEGLTIEELGASVGIPDFMKTNYEDLSSEDRIRYRLVIYVVIFNRFIVETERDLSDLIVNFVTSVHGNDFTEAELDFLTRECLNNGFIDDVSKIFRLAPNSSFRRTVEKLIGISANEFEKYLNGVTSAVSSLPFLTRSTDSRYLNHGLSMENEDFYKSKHISRLNTASSTANSCDEIIDEDSGVDITHYLADGTVRTKRSHEESELTQSSFNSHFLSRSQFTQLIYPVVNRNDIPPRSFTVPCPDKDFFVARMDNLMQNLDSADFGETAWKVKIQDLSVEARETYAENEKTLDSFVHETFKIIYSLHLTPRRAFSITFNGSPSFGNGLKQETIEMFNSAILLPKYKIFYYNSRILGFVPYPLLDSVVLGMLGFLNSFSISVDQPVCWQFSSEYTKFLFYEENPFQDSMEDLVKVLYRSLFDNIEALVDPNMNPIDYFPTSFHSHQPFPFESGKPNTFFDLFAPFDSSKARFANMGTYLSDESIELLDEIIILPSSKRARFSESKEEDVNYAIESKSNDSDDEEEEFDEKTFKLEERFNRQQALKRKIVDAITQTLTDELIEHLLAGRFNFMRMYLRAFNSLSQKFITANFYDQLQAAHSKPFTAEEIISGLRYQGSEMSEIKIIGMDEDDVLTPVQTLNFLIQSFDTSMLRTFYWFCTGCFSLPIGGLDTNPITVQIIDKLLLPSSQTCFRTFKFHVQRTVKANLGALKTALMESSGYHYIENHNQRPIDAAEAGNMAAILALNANGGDAAGNAVDDVAGIVADDAAGEQMVAGGIYEDQMESGDIYEES